MFNKKAILLVIIFSLFVTSCANYFNPYDVKNVKDETSSDNDENIEPLPNGKGKMKLTIISLGFRNIDSESAGRYGRSGSVVKLFGGLCGCVYIGYDMKVDFYSSSSDKHSLSSFAKLVPKYAYHSLELPSPDHVLGILKERLLSKDYSLVYNDNDDITILMSVNLTKYDRQFGPEEKLCYPYAYSENDKIKITLKYNKNNETFELVDVHDGYGDRIKDKTFSLIVNENEEAEVFMRIDGMDGPDNRRNCKKGPTGWNNQIEVIIKFKFKIIQ
uniref:hypothetical protein n=1 Tax=Brachyspira catarrhinii TaxID=2528966 RepID=UPI003F4BA301